MAEHSIVVRVADQFSAKMLGMTKQGAAFSKAIGEAESKLSLINKRKVAIETNVAKAQAEVRSMASQLDGTTESIANLNAARINLENMKRELAKVTEEASGANQELTDLASNGLSGSALARSMLEDPKLGEAAQGLVSAVATSAFGQTGGRVAGVLSSTLGGALSGGLTGAIVGFVSSVISGITKEFEARDAFFKNYYKDLYEEVTASTDEKVDRGIAAAGKQDALIAQLSKTGSVSHAYLETVSKGLNNLDAYSALANYSGMDYGETVQRINDGQVSGEEMAKAILTALGKDPKQWVSYTDQLEKADRAVQSVEAGIGEGYQAARLSGLQREEEFYSGELGDELKEFNRTIGASRAQMENLEEQYSQEAWAYVLGGQDGELGLHDSKELKQIRGQYEVTNMVAGLMRGFGLDDQADYYAGLKNESIDKQMQVLSGESFESSEMAQARNEAEKDLVGSIRDLTRELGAWKLSYELDQQWTRGLASNESIVHTRLEAQGGGKSEKQAAWGLNRVPYDNFPALLHEGERVLTASEARAEDRVGESVTVQVAGNQFIIREEADIGRVAAALAEQIQTARMGGVYSNV